VPPGDDYYLVAFDGSFFGAGTPSGISYDPQFWDHINFSALLYTCGCAPTLPVTPVTVGAAWPGPAITDIDFDLLSYSKWIYFPVEAQRLPGDPYPGLQVILDKWDAGTSSWDLGVASDVTDADGYADLFGFEAGDYRVRYTAGGVALAVVSYDDYSGGPYPLYDGGTSVEFPTLYPTSPGCGCGPSSFEVQELYLLFPAAPGGGSGGTPTTHPASHRTVPTVIAPTATPTPTPTPTSTPSPSSSSTAQPESTPTATPEPAPAPDVGFPWWIILIIVLVVGVIVIAYLIFRRR
jgi:hypothetical protein